MPMLPLAGTVPMRRDMRHDEARALPDGFRDGATGRAPMLSHFAEPSNTEADMLRRAAEHARDDKAEVVKGCSRSFDS